MSLKTPFDGNVADVHRETVILGDTRLPLSDPVFSANLKSIITDSWSANINQRPEFVDVSLLLRKEIGAIRGESLRNSMDVSSHTERSL
jgi:hypothetical protein